MSVTVLRFLLVLGIIGHAVNMYCDRIISIFPNGRLKIEDIKTIGEEGKMAKLMEGVSEKVPMRSAVWGAYSLVLQFFGYFAITAYIYGKSKIYGSVMFAAIVMFITVGAAHHVKTALMEYVFLYMGKDARAKDMMVSLYNSETATTKCYIGYLVYIFALIIAIVTGTAAVPVWAVIFTVLPIFIAMFPFRIIGTLHIAAMATMLAWIFLV